METSELCFRWLNITKACQYEMAAVPTEWLLILSRDDWSIYTHALAYACTVLPADLAEDADLLEELFDRYSDWENAGFPETG